MQHSLEVKNEDVFCLNLPKFYKAIFVYFKLTLGNFFVEKAEESNNACGNKIIIALNFKGKKSWLTHSSQVSHFVQKPVIALQIK